MANDSYFDQDPTETKEWLDALQSVIAIDGPERASFLLKKLIILSLYFG